MANELENAANVETTETKPETSTADKDKQIKALEAEIAKLKQSVTNASADASKWKKELQARQTEEERTKQQQEEAYAAMQNKLAALEAERNVANYKAEFVSIGFADDISQEAAEALNGNDTAKLFEGIRKFVASHDKELQAKALMNNPTLPGGNTEKVVSREEFDAMGYKEMVAFQSEHPDLYAEYMKR